MARNAAWSSKCHSFTVFEYILNAKDGLLMCPHSCYKGHVELGYATLTNTAETAYHQGIDLYVLQKKQRRRRREEEEEKSDHPIFENALADNSYNSSECCGI